MQKIIKRVSLILAVALSVVCLCMFASACGEATEFTVTVYYSDGTTKVNGDDYTVVVQFCVDDACYSNNPTVDKNGEAKISIATLEGWKKSDEYVLHVFDSDGNVTIKSGDTKVSKSSPTAKLVIDKPAP